MVSDIDKAYTAGLFDGEGSVSLLANPTFWLRLDIANTDLNVLQWVQDNFGGSIHKRNPIEGSKQQYTWYASNKKIVASFLAAILPYSKIKREKLLLAQEFMDIAVARENRGSRTFSKEEDLQRAIKVVQMKALNQRGG